MRMPDANSVSLACKTPKSEWRVKSRVWGCRLWLQRLTTSARPSFAVEVSCSFADDRQAAKQLAMPTSRQRPARLRLCGDAVGSMNDMTSQLLPSWPSGYLPEPD
jgi:hypothetical protein